MRNAATGEVFSFALVMVSGGNGYEYTGTRSDARPHADEAETASRKAAMDPAGDAWSG